MTRTLPEYINGKPYVELLSYGEKHSMGHSGTIALNHFAGKKHLTFLEVGVLRGHNAEVMLDAFGDQLDTMILVDPWDFCAETHVNNWADTWFRMQGRRNAIVIKATSEDASKILNMNFDYAFIDGDHTGGDLSPGNPQDGIRMDIKLWWPRIKEGGILSGHDYNYENIMAEVDKVFGDKVNSSPPHPMGGQEWWVFK